MRPSGGWSDCGPDRANPLIGTRVHMGVRYVNGVAEVAEVKFVPPWHPDHPIWADKNAGDPHRAKFKSLVEQCLDFPPWGGFGAADKTRQLGTILAAYDADIARARAGVI